MTNFVGNCDPKIQPGVFANGGRLLSVAGGREIGEAQQVAVRQVVRADVVSGKRKKAVRVSAPESLSRLPLSLSLSRLLARCVRWKDRSIDVEDDRGEGLGKASFPDDASSRNSE